MHTTMEIVFPDGKKVDALYQGFTIQTDQIKKAGGEGTAPEPFDLFLASIGTCAGIYVLNFCKERKISTDGLKMQLNIRKNKETRLIDKISIKIHLPSEFPEKYIKAIIKSVDHCAVKAHMVDAPAFEYLVKIDEAD